MKKLFIMLLLPLLFILSACKEADPRDYEDLDLCVDTVVDGDYLDACTNAKGKFEEYLDQYTIRFSETNIDRAVTVTYDDQNDILYLNATYHTISDSLETDYAIFEDMYFDVLHDMKDITEITFWFTLQIEKTTSHYIRFAHMDDAEDSDIVSLTIDSSQTFKDEFTSYQTWFGALSESKDFSVIRLTVNAFDYDVTMVVNPDQKSYQFSSTQLITNPRQTESDLETSIISLLPDDFQSE